jgi:hypothetical protein
MVSTLLALLTRSFARDAENQAYIEVEWHHCSHISEYKYICGIMQCVALVATNYLLLDGMSTHSSHCGRSHSLLWHVKGMLCVRCNNYNKIVVGPMFGRTHYPCRNITLSSLVLDKNCVE